MVLSPPHTPASSEDVRVLASSTPCLRKYSSWIWSELLGKGQEEGVCRYHPLLFPLSSWPSGQTEPTPGYRIPHGTL